MFATIVHVNANSFLGQRLSFLQMLISLAAIQGVKKLLNGQDIGGFLTSIKNQNQKFDLF